MLPYPRAYYQTSYKGRGTTNSTNLTFVYEILSRYDMEITHVVKLLFDLWVVLFSSPPRQPILELFDADHRSLGSLPMATGGPECGSARG